MTSFAGFVNVNRILANQQSQNDRNANNFLSKWPNALVVLTNPSENSLKQRV